MTFQWQGIGMKNTIFGIEVLTGDKSCWDLCGDGAVSEILDFIIHQW